MSFQTLQRWRMGGRVLSAEWIALPNLHKELETWPSCLLMQGRLSRTMQIVDRNRGWESSPYIAPVYFYGSGKPYSQGTVHLTVGTGGRPVEDVGERPGVHEKPCIVKQTLGNVFLGGQSWIEREKDCSNGCFSKDNTAYINTDIGFGVIEANRDKLHFKFISAEFPGELVDEMIMCTMPDCKPAPMVFIDGGGYGIAEEVQDEPAEDANKPQNHTEAEQKVPGTGASDAQQTIPTQEDSATPPETPAQAKSPSQDNPPPKQSWQEDTTGSKDAASSPRPANTTQPEKQPPQSPADLDKGTPKPAEGSSVMKPSGPGPSAKDTSREIGEVQPVRLDEPLQQRVKLSIWPDLRTKPKDKYELDEDEEPPEDIPQPGTLFLPVYVPSQQRYAPMPVGMDLDEFLKQYRSSDNIAGGAPGGISKPVVGSDPAGTAVPGWDDPAKDTTPSAEDIASALEEGAPSAPRNTALVIAASAAACGLVLLISVSLVAWRVMRKPNNGQNKSVAGGKSPPIYDPSAGPGDLEVHVAGVIQGGVMSRTPGGRA